MNATESVEADPTYDDSGSDSDEIEPARLCIPLTRCLILDQHRLRPFTFQCVFEGRIAATLAASRLSEAKEWLRYLRACSVLDEGGEERKGSDPTLMESVLSAMDGETQANMDMGKMSDSTSLSQPSSAPSSAPAKVTISDFEILKVLGQGQYGKVRRT